MRRPQEQEPLLPPWVMSFIWKFGPIAVLVAIYYFLSYVLHLRAAILIPALLVLVVAVLVYVGGRLYKPFYVSREGRCVAANAKQRAGCRHYVPGARLGGACGRLREDGRCRYVR